MGYLDYAGLQYLWGKLKEKFAPKSHSHDDRYYTEAEMDGKLNSKVNNNEAGANSLLSKLTTSWTATPTDNTYFIRQDTGGGDSFGRVKFSTLWNYIKGKADGTYQPKGSYAASNHSHTKDQVGLGNVDNTADSVKSVAVANFAKETYINRYKTVNLTDLDQNTWYPVTGTSIPYKGLKRFKCNVQLNSGSKPSWSTHSGGFTAVVDILEESSGWGTTGMLGEVLINDQRFIADESKPPVGYQQMSYGSIPVWWLRGGGTYFLAADYDCAWTIQKSKYENNGQSIAPTTTYPGVNVNRATITANLNGNASTADVAIVGVRDYNNANNIIKIGWSGADLDANTLSYVAGYTSDMKIHTASKDGVRSWLGLGAAAYKKIQSLSAVGHSDWQNQSTDDGYVPTMAFMAFWNGAFNGSGNSNLQYCDRGRFGTIVTKNSGDYAAAGHTHNYAGSSSAGGSANSAVKLDTSAGSATQPVYFKDGKPVATTYALNKTVPADAKFTDTNTWRGIQNNLTSDSTDQSLSAAQGKALKTLVDGKAPSVHTHTKSQITDFPTSMPASDVSAWAKAATKPSYTKAEVGLGNVDNTADKDKNVKYATSAGSVTNAKCLNNDDKYMKFHWSGQDGQPTWLWGGNDSGDMYVYNPSNFSVKYATSAGTALTAKNLPYSITYEGSYVGTAVSDSIYNANNPNYATEANPVKTTLSREYDVVVFLDACAKGRWVSNYDETCPEKYAFLRLMNAEDKFTESYIVMSALTSEWVRGLSGYQNSNNVKYGPVIQYENSPKKSIMYRKNGTTIERCWTRELISKDNTLGKPGSAGYIDKGAYMLLDRTNITYHVFGIDINRDFFTAAHATEEGSEVV